MTEEFRQKIIQIEDENLTILEGLKLDYEDKLKEMRCMYEQ